MSVMRPYWIWPLRLPVPMQTGLSQGALELSLRLDAWRAWSAAAILAGLLPLLLAFWTGYPGQELVSATLLMPLLVAAVRRDSLLRGLAVLGLAFLAHNALCIALAAWWPEQLARILPHGLRYYRESRDWIETGASPEYDLAHWAPAHLQLIAASSLFTYSSFGVITLWQGVHEVDLMNFYVGQLAANSSSAGLAVAVGWHPWSVCRGLGYLLLTFEIASLSFSRLVNTPLSTPPRRRLRWAIGIGFLLLDGMLKICLLEPVRATLQANLIGG